MFSLRGKTTRERSNKWIFWTMLVFGCIGLLVSFILSNDEIQLMKHPDAILSCSLNAVLNCSTVMKTWQASVFGFPNMLIGLMAFPVVISVAVVALNGAKLPRRFWITANICYGLGAIFAYWLFFQSLYNIEVLCPWCLVITFSTTILFAVVTHYTLRENMFGFDARTNERIQALQSRDVGKLVTATWIVLLVVLVVMKFGDSLLT